MGKLTVVTASLCVGVVLAELALRVSGFNRLIFVEPDFITGSKLRPGVEFVFSLEGLAHVHINQFGNRDQDRKLRKDATTFRIAVLGDSYAEAMQVEQEETFWSILETRLNQCNAFGKAVEVLNFGVHGYGTAQELLALRTRVWQFGPDMVLLAFLTGNDVRNNSRVLEPEKLRPFYWLDDHERLQLDESFRTDPAFIRSNSSVFRLLRQAGDYSRLMQLLSAVRSVLRQRAVEHPAGATSRIQSEVGLDDKVYLDDAGPEWREAWRITEALLAQLHVEVRDKGKDLVVVTLSNGIQVTPDVEEYKSFVASLGVADLFGPERRVAAFGREHGFHVVNLAYPLARIAHERGVYLHGFGDNVGGGHWNQAGHRAAAQVLGESFCDRGEANEGR